MLTGHAHEGARQLLVCCDGTKNTLTGRRRDTNVLKTIELLDPDFHNQKLYYDPGVGSADQLPATTAWDAFTRRLNRLHALVSGKGIYENIADAYRFIVDNYREGDQIFLFGFSRGAFTVRSVSGMINLFGIVRAEHVTLIPTMINVYFSKPNAALSGDAHLTRAAVAHQICERFASDQGRRVKIHFIGVWDTVESVGFPLFNTTISSDGFTKPKNCLTHIRHALALDEHRYAFRPRLYWDANYELDGRSLKQLWFRGAHSDLGGGYPQDHECRLSDDAFWWMMREAQDKNLRFKQKVPSAPHPPDNDPRCHLVHNECRSNPYWGVAGMTIRRLEAPAEAYAEKYKSGMLHNVELYEPQRAVVAGNERPRALKQPGTHQWASFALAALITVVLYLIVALLSNSALTGSWTSFWPWDPSPIDRISMTAATSQFAYWQLTAVRMAIADATPALPAGFSPYYAMWAVLWDFGFIAAYAYVLGFFSSWAFSGLAGLHSIPQREPRWLHLAGWFPCLAVFADIAENLLTLSLLALYQIDWIVLMRLSAALLSAASVLKWLMLVLSAVMLVCGLLRFSIRKVSLEDAAHQGNAMSRKG